MAQLNFYLGEEDKINLMSFIFSEGGYIIPALQYDKSNYTVIKSTEDYLPFVNKSVLLFIVHESYFQEPLAWDTIKKEGRELFYIPQRTGGPTIDFYSPGIIDKDGIRFIGQGSISYYASYQSIVQRSNIEAPESQKIFYRKLCSRIKKGFAIKLSKRIYWVGNRTLTSLRNGSKLMNVSDNILTEFLDFAQVD